jgi:hypothetical protein
MHAELIPSPIDTKLVVSPCVFAIFGEYSWTACHIFIVSQVEQHSHIEALKNKHVG